MARIRSIKPEFFTSEDICSLSAFARILYIGLWCEADREGRLNWKPRTFKLRYMPADDVDIEGLCAELVAAGLVIPYEIDGKEYAEIPGFSRHQVINNKEKDSEIPQRVKDACNTRESGVLGEGKGKEGKEGSTRDVTREEKPPAQNRAVAIPKDFEPNDTNRKIASDNRIRLDAEVAKFCDYHRAKGSKFKDWHAALNNWLRRAPDYGGAVSASGPKMAPDNPHGDF